MVKRLQGTVGCQPPGHEGPLLLIPDAGRMDERIPRPWQKDDWNQGTEICHYGTRLERNVPAGVTKYKSPTGIVWLLGRIYCTGTPEDYKAVHALQDQIGLCPLSSYGKPYTPAPGQVECSVDGKTAVREQLNAMDGASYFKLFAELLKTNPPAAEDAPMVTKLAKIGIVPGQSFIRQSWNPQCRTE